MNMIYDPLEDRVLIKEIKKTEPETTAAGIITDTIQKETAEGIVAAVGDGYTARDTGTFIQTVLRKGDLVLFGKNAGMKIDVPNEDGTKTEHRLMREGDVLLLIKKSSDK